MADKGFLNSYKEEDMNKAFDLNEDVERMEEKKKQEFLISKIDNIKERVEKSGRYSGFPNFKIKGSDFKINCSSIGKFMTEPREKSNMKKFEEAQDKYNKFKDAKKKKEDSIKKALDDLQQKIDAKVAYVKEKELLIENGVTPSEKKKLEQTISKGKAYVEANKGKKKDLVAEKKRVIDDMEIDLKKLKDVVDELFKVKDVLVLSESCKDVIVKWINNKKYGRRKEFTSKQTYKGKKEESEGIKVYNQVCGTEGEKNDVRLYSEWIHGEFDYMPINLPRVVDIKSSWDKDTFPEYENAIPEKDYIKQLWGYMHLVVENELIPDDKIEELHAELAYVLVNASPELIESQMRRKKSAEFLPKLTPEQEEDIYYNMTFNDIPIEGRVKRFRFYPNDDYIEKVKRKVERVRPIIDEMLTNNNMLIEINS